MESMGRVHGELIVPLPKQALRQPLGDVVIADDGFGLIPADLSGKEHHPARGGDGVGIPPGFPPSRGLQDVHDVLR